MVRTLVWIRVIDQSSGRAGNMNTALHLSSISHSRNKKTSQKHTGTSTIAVHTWISLTKGSYTYTTEYSDDDSSNNKSPVRGCNSSTQQYLEAMTEKCGSVWRHKKEAQQEAAARATEDITWARNNNKKKQKKNTNAQGNKSSNDHRKSPLTNKKNNRTMSRERTLELFEHMRK